MQDTTFFMYFLLIWAIGAVSIVTLFFIKGSKAIKMFDSLDLNRVIYSEKSASGYSTKSFRTRWGGASKVLHIIITDKELVIKTFLFLAYIAKRHDMLHRIPLENIVETRIEKGTFYSKLHVHFNVGGEKKEVVLMSRNNERIKKILDELRIME